MASLAAGVIDPTKVGKYRVVLSDALLGKEPKEVYTGVRYNHKPSLSSPSAPHQARIKPTGSADSYDLSFQDDGGRYAYQGTRGHEGNQYVLLFDPDKEVFVLHHVDSIFNMNLVRTPTNTDADNLRQQHPQLEAHSSSRTNKTMNKASSNKPTKPTKPTKPAKAKKPAVLKEPKSARNLEPPKPTRPIKSNHMDHDSNDESSDDDLLTIEDPGGAAPAPNRDFSPGFIDKPRRFSEFVQQQNEEEEEEADDEYPEIEIDADGEEEDEDDEDDNFKLPSPIHRQMMSQNINGSGAHNNLHSSTQVAPVEEESDEDEDDEPAAQDDIGVDLEAELMAELEREESDVSEEE